MSNTRKLSVATLALLTTLAAGLPIAHAEDTPAPSSSESTPSETPNNNGDDTQDDSEGNTQDGDTRSNQDGGSEDNPQDDSDTDKKETNSKLAIKTYDISNEEAKKQLSELKLGKSRAGMDEHFADFVTEKDGPCKTDFSVMVRDMDNVGIGGGDQECTIDSGVLVSPYSGNSVDSKDVTVDHIVSPANAFASGAKAWNKETKTKFFNDQLNLIAVSMSDANLHGGQRFDKWQPENKEFQDAFARRYIQVKHAYGLTVTRVEKAALSKAIGAHTAPTDRNATNAPRVSPAPSGNVSRSARVNRMITPPRVARDIPKQQKVSHKNIGIVNNAKGNHDDITIGIISFPDGRVEFRTGDGKNTAALANSQQGNTSRHYRGESKSSSSAIAGNDFGKVRATKKGSASGNALSTNGIKTAKVDTNRR